MLKDFLLVRAAPTVSLDQVCHYLEFKHAPLALSVPVVSQQMRRYTFNLVKDEPGSDVALHKSQPRLAAVVEHMLGGWEGLARISADPQYLAKVRPDEAYMIANLMAAAPQFIVIDEERPVFTSSTETHVRVFDFLRRPVGMAREEFLQALDADAKWSVKNSGYRSVVARRTHSISGASWVAPKEEAVSYGTDNETFDAVVEAWVTGVYPAELLQEQRQRRAQFCDSNRSYTAVTEEHCIRWEKQPR